MTNRLNNTVPVADRYALTVEEAAFYFGIGQKKIRALAAEHEDEGIILHVGGRMLIKRKAFESFLNRANTL